MLMRGKRTSLAAHLAGLPRELPRIVFLAMIKMAKTENDLKTESTESRQGTTM
jgi:hypothetical protein